MFLVRAYQSTKSTLLGRGADSASQSAKRISGGILALVLLVAVPCSALDPNKAVSQYVIETWQTEDGLPISSVQAVLQTSDGYLWLASQGLVRFDGVKFTIFDTRNTPAMKVNRVLTLFEDHEDTLWVGTFGGGLMRLKDGQFTTFTTDDGLCDDHVTSIAEDADGVLWIASHKGVCSFENGRFSPLVIEGELPSQRVHSILIDRTGSLWIGTTDGLARVHGSELIPFTDSSQETDWTVLSLLEGSTGDIWIGTEDKGLLRHQDEKFKAFAEAEGLTGEAIMSIAKDRQGNVWVGTMGGGLGRLRDERFTIFSSLNGLNNDMVRSVYEDREGSLWLGTHGGGLSRLTDGIFTTISPYEGLSSDIVSSITGDDQGTLWIGTDNDGLNRLKDGVITRFTVEDGLPSNEVTPIYGGANGSLWIGTNQHGLALYDHGGFTTLTVEDSLTSNKIAALYRDFEGILWVGTARGLNSVTDGKIETWTGPDGPLEERILAITGDQQGVLWVGSIGSGLFRLENGTLQAMTTEDGLASNTVVALHMDRAGILWIATYGAGLNRLEDGHLTTYTTKDGLHDDLVYQILEDGENNLWMSSNRGIFSVSRADLDGFAQGTSRSITSVVYGVADGMRTAECNGGFQPAGWRTEDGALWFPTAKGVVTVAPDTIEPNPLPPPVIIEQVVVNGETVPFDGQQQFPANSSSFEIHYTGLSFVTPEKVEFRFKLEGFDHEWRDAGSRRIAYYTNLKPRSYNFRVIACNNDGIWNETGASLRFSVLPHFYQTTWFYGLSLLLVLLFLRAGYRFRIASLKTRESELVERVEERTRELRQKSDELLKLNAIVKSINAKHRFANLLTAILQEMHIIRGMQRAAALVWDPARQSFTFMASTGIELEAFATIEMSAKETEHGFIRGASEIFEDIFVAKQMGGADTEALFGHLGIPKSMLVMRIRVEDEVRAYFIFDNLDDEDAFDDHDVNLLKNLKEHVVSAFIKTSMLSELRFLDEKKNEFLGMAAHDLRGPLGIISSWVTLSMKELQGGRSNSTKVAGHLSRVDRVVQHMLRLVSDLLDISAIESGKLNLESRRESLVSILEECEHLYSEIAQQKKIQLIVRLDPSVPDVLVDRNRILEVMDNLVSNAIKYTHSGGEVRIGCSGHQNEVETYVEDTGQGLSEEDLKLVFQRFEKLSARPTAGETSTGLGLAIAKKIIEEHGGRIWVESTAGEGATFRFTLPVFD